ncbi:hypothetical protein FJZ53_03695, partial [Candidatus Woesearchaeota archaeon]|nr:hypothetical protein [Candidatus Woesearchaeota archaeon]
MTTNTEAFIKLLLYAPFFMYNPTCFLLIKLEGKLLNNPNAFFMIMIKRGISPLIATVLILGFVIVVAVIIMLFGKEFVEKSTQRADVQSDKDMSCVNDVIYEIKSACYSDKGSSRIKILIFNNGNKDLRKFYVRFYESSSKVTDRAVAPEGGSIK